MSLSFGAPMTGVNATWSSAKRSLASLGVVMVPTVRGAFRRRERQGGSAVVSVVTEQW